MNNWLRELLYCGTRPMTVWRVENWRGWGPYQSRPIDMRQDEKERDWPWTLEYNNRWYHPLPKDDAALRSRYYDNVTENFYGFPTVEDYIKWFNKKSWRESLRKLGFLLVEYDAPDATYGENQVIFNRKKAIKLAQYSPTAFDEQFGDRWEIR